MASTGTTLPVGTLRSKALTEFIFWTTSVTYTVCFTRILERNYADLLRRTVQRLMHNRKQKRHLDLKRLTEHL